MKKSGKSFVSFSKYRTFALANGNRCSHSNTKWCVSSVG